MNIGGKEIEMLGEGELEVGELIGRGREGERKEEKEGKEVSDEREITAENKIKVGRWIERGKEIPDEWEIPAKEMIEIGRWKRGKEGQILEKWELQIDRPKGEKEMD